MLRITVLGAAATQRDALMAALARYAANTGLTHHITTEAGGDLTLLMGLNRSDASTGSTPDLADQALRSHLNDTRQPYQVLYGVLSEQLTQAVRVLHIYQRTNSSEAAQNTSAPTKASHWRWACDKCSDPACEHKLLTDLLARRTPQV